MNAFPKFLLPLLCAALLSCSTDPEDLTPGLSYKTESGGCASVTVFKSNSAGTEYIVVWANRDSLGLSTTPRTFDIGSATPGLSAKIDMYASRPDQPFYCSDVLNANDPKPATWKALSGRVTIVVSNDVPAPFNETYQTTVKLENVLFQSPDGTRKVTLKELSFENVAVGWLPG